MAKAQAAIKQESLDLRKYLKPVILGLVFLAVISGGGYWLKTSLQNPELLPIKEVLLTGENHYLDQDALQRILDKSISEGFFSLDIENLHRSIKEMPWLASATVRRIWPDKLVVQVKEHVPFARWGDSALVSYEAVIFKPGSINAFHHLPLIRGDEKRVKDILSSYRHVIETLGLKEGIKVFNYNDRSSVSLVLNNAIEIQLGNEELAQRLARVKRFLDRVKEQNALILKSIDARYSSGVAVVIEKNNPTASIQTGESIL